MELMNTPKRKRKRGCSMVRTSRIVKMSWRENEGRTTSLCSELGVEKLPESDEEDNVSKISRLGSNQLSIDIKTMVQFREDQLLSSHIQTLGPSGVFSTQLSPPIAQSDILGELNTTACLVRRKRIGPFSSFTSDPWNKLSDEMVLNIFKWLPKTTLSQCLRVCRRWNRLGLDETLWYRLDLSGRTLKPGEIGPVLDRGVNVLRLAQSTIQAPVYPDVNIQQEQQFSKLLYLDLTMCNANPEALEQLLSTTFVLRKLSLENCKINSAVCRAISQDTNLEVLNLNMCEGITQAGLMHICNNLQKLEALNIGWTNLSRDSVVHLVSCLPQSLTKLNMAGCRDMLLDQDVEILCCTCPNLKELDLSDATGITGLAVDAIATRLRGLEYVALSRCYNVLPSSLPQLGEIATLLALDVFGMLRECAVDQLSELIPHIALNKFPFSSIARPTTGRRRTSIWGLRVRDVNVY